MGTLSTSPLLPKELRPSSLYREHRSSVLVYPTTRRKSKKSQSLNPVARLFGPAIFEASKLQVVFLGVDEEKHPGQLPRAYTFTHSDVTSKLTLAISQTINNSQIQGWYSKLQRDEVVAEWKKVKGKMSLHVHCHISGGHFLLDLCARLRYWIFCKELPVVLKAFVYADGGLLNNYPELQEALVWVYFHSNIPEFNKVECWGPLQAAASPSSGIQMENKEIPASNCWDMPKPCQEACSCCFPPMSLIPWSQSFSSGSKENDGTKPQGKSLQQQQS
ncbi:protein STAY-GREEN, chloroplastic-like [Coffea eugenioides]|uniref:Protein STAY-GREEN 1, chloroplastic-like n=1 Tax=Coffea arabica TaxID=13443 RepID=A0A6P6TQZ6_COFAR|nr:protein STAY-GREEN, chloroplastic-like [Coffea arabica]XP_027181228.1 protein STAY-GREEN, chloroplastic-like [Coffea eugenioides]